MHRQRKHPDPTFPVGPCRFPAASLPQISSAGQAEYLDASQLHRRQIHQLSTRRKTEPLSITDYPLAPAPIPHLDSTKTPLSEPSPAELACLSSLLQPPRLISQLLVCTIMSHGIQG
ncbi:hypothetical protein EJ04DRAFT_218716 [Polyplosphaeria fusca]|uniref:Uncharacterized protein n=1 Tax=Polyplosphaeria fusca TaxID=682080 RepID=A0A9P4QZ96_9PLEO|nr:hypothetical protein EJ04DRAFT_218716 [Polyplosphaeria fusca]